MSVSSMSASSMPSLVSDPPPGPGQSRVPAIVCLMVAACLYVLALTFSRGFVHSRWLLLSLGALLLVVVAVLLVGAGRGRATARLARLPEGLAVTAILLQVGLLLGTPLSDAFEGLPGAVKAALRVAGVGLAICGALAAMGGRGWRAWALLLLAGLLHVGVGIVLIRQGTPVMDVYVFHQDSAAALLRGVNPYSIDFPNIYGDDAWVYSQQVMRDGRVDFGFPYPPISLLAYLPSFALTGESRYAHLLALSLAALITWRIGRSALAVLAATLILCSPIGWRVVEFSWSEPFLVLGLSLVAWAGVRKPALLPYLLGIFLCTKQYCVIFVPLVGLLLPRPLFSRESGAFLAKMIGTGAALSLPLAVWDWGAFWHSNVTIQVMQPFRPDSFSFLALFYTPGQPPPSSLIPFLALLPVYGLIYWRSPRSIGGFVLSLALLDMVFLFTNRQAFLNYHLFAQLALLIAAVVIEAEVPQRLQEREETPEADLRA